MATTYTNENQSAATSYANQSRSLDEDYLLMETAEFLLLEIGDRIILEQTVAGETPYSYQAQS